MAKNSHFETPDIDSVDQILNGLIKSSADTLQLVEAEANHGRLPASDVIPAPATSLGLALGVGGLPRGKVVHMWGEKHGGKTMLSNHFIAEAQKVGIPTVILDAEAAADGAFMDDLGVDVNLVRIVQPVDLESLCTAIRQLAKSGALIVVDSIAASESSAELERNLAKDHTRVGGNAQLWKATLAGFRPLARKYGTTLIMINQMRANFNAGMMGDPNKPYGPEAIQHNTDISIRVRPVKEKKDNLKKSGYKISRIKFEKNRFNNELPTIDLVFKPGFPYNKSIDLVRCCDNPIDMGSDVTYGLMSRNALVGNTSWDDQKGEFISKNNRYAINIDPLMMTAIQIDDPEFDEVEVEPLDPEVINVDDDGVGQWTVEDPAPDIDEENAEGFTLPGVGEANAAKWLSHHPTARNLISERLLNSLNRKREFMHEIQ